MPFWLCHDNEVLLKCNFFTFISGKFGADYFAIGVFVEDVSQLFDSVKHAPQERNCLAHLAMTIKLLLLNNESLSVNVFKSY